MKHRSKYDTVVAGFTTTELLIVIVFVATLLAISAMAYNSMQVRAKTSAAQTTLTTLSKKLQAYHRITGVYPSTTNAVISDLSKYPGSKITSGDIAIGDPTADNGASTTRVELCGGGAGVKLTPFDYRTGAVSAIITNMGDVSGSCVTASA